MQCLLRQVGDVRLGNRVIGQKVSQSSDGLDPDVWLDVRGAAGGVATEADGVDGLCVTAEIFIADTALERVGLAATGGDRFDEAVF